jgi:hypothetical protein
MRKKGRFISGLIILWRVSMNSDYEAIKDYVDDHYAHFGTYPMDVETDTQVYTFDQYWAILDAGGEHE